MKTLDTNVTEFMAIKTEDDEGDADSRTVSVLQLQLQLNLEEADKLVEPLQL